MSNRNEASGQRRREKIYKAPPSHWLEAGREAMVDMGLSECFADALTEYNKVFSEGLGDFTTGDVEELTGHQARSFETFARDFAEMFVPAAATV